LWSVVIEETSNETPRADEGAAKVWNSTTDFPSNSVNTLDAWELLAQVVLCSNELLFVD
jgi:hypothetical protein